MKASGQKSLLCACLTKEQDYSTREEIQTLLTNGDYTELHKRLSTRIDFGTAGLRARMEAGFSRMNCLTVIQASQGLAEYLLGADESFAERGVVIGHDTRHNSWKFADLTAAAFAGKGFKVYMYEDYVHTPLVPCGVDVFNAAAGVMITASHNPAADNGYKVYAFNACQIKSPVDKQIASSILQNLDPLEWELTSALRKKLVPNLLARVKDVYFRRISDIIDKNLWSTPFPKFVYTPMHGVGLPYMQEAMKQLRRLDPGAQYGDVYLDHIMTVVEEQAHPDPDFPTVRFPNPEEEGALDLAMRIAENVGAKLVLATDPDADRFAAAEFVDGHWHQFTGDQMGVLLAWHLTAVHHRPDDHLPNTPTTMLNSAVSSQMLAAMGQASGFHVEECMTGFKWLGNRALELGQECVFAYEEALGYMFPNVAHDKDGIAAAVHFLQACAKWEGSPWKTLQGLYRDHGYFETKNTYWKSPDVATTKRVFERIRALGDPYPENLGKKVLRWRDLTRPGFDSGTAGNVPELPVSSGQMITCWLEGGENDQGIRFTVRASGTEPKIKGTHVIVSPSTR